MTQITLLNQVKFKKQKIIFLLLVMFNEPNKNKTSYISPPKNLINENQKINNEESKIN